MLYSTRAIRARRCRLLSLLYFRERPRTFHSSLDTHSYDSYSAAERTPARAEATRPTLRVANSLQAHTCACTAPRGDMTLFKRSQFKIPVRRGRCGARGPGALRRRVACRTARRHDQPTRRTRTRLSPRTNNNARRECGDARVDVAKVAAKVATAAAKVVKDYQRVHHTRWWGSPRRKEASQADDSISRPPREAPS